MIIRGKVFGATMLIAGCCTGAGMLGLPVLTAAGGFFPTVFLFTFCWLFMAITALLLLEVNLWFKEEVNIVSMASATLGRAGKVISLSLFAFLFYSLMTAYAAGSGQLFADFMQKNFSFEVADFVGSVVFSFLFAGFLYLGTASVDLINRLLMLGFMGAYLVLVVLGVRHVNPGNLQHADFKQALIAVPAMIISFGFHNLIPTLRTYLAGDRRKLCFVILLGSSIPLAIYLLWEWVMLGVIPFAGEGGLGEAISRGELATRALRRAVGSDWIVDVTEYFAFFAITTSFLSVALSFVDFLADAFKIEKRGLRKILLCILSLLPPLLFSLVYPAIFLSALSYAGAFGAVILFGVIPALMVWSGRYRQKLGMAPVVPGGRATLVFVIVFSLAVFFLEILYQANVIM